MRKKTTLAIATAFAALALAIPPSASAAEPVLDLQAAHYPPTMAEGTHARYQLTIENTGDEETTSAVQVSFSVPPGLEITSVTDEVKESIIGELVGMGAWSCTIAPDSQSVDCVDSELLGLLLGPPFGPTPIFPGSEACTDFYELIFGEGLRCRIAIMVKAQPGTAPSSLTPVAEACGGGATNCDAASDPIDVVPGGFRLESFDGQVLDRNGDPATQAGSHPDMASTEFSMSRAMDQVGFTWPIETLKDAVAELPPGVVGNAAEIPTCDEAQLASGPLDKSECPIDSQVGIVTLAGNGLGAVFPGGAPIPSRHPVFNMVPPKGTPAVLGFKVFGVTVHVYASLRTGEDYGITVTTKNAAEGIPFEGVTFDVWGIPADSSHDDEREKCLDGGGGVLCPAEVPPRPFLTLPTSCAGEGPNNSVETKLQVTSWLESADSASFFSHDNTEPVPNPIGTTGCNATPFEPTLEARPTTNVADAPSGLDVELHIPQSEKCSAGPPVSCEDAQAHLKDTTVALPGGLVVNPSGANGLDGCSLSEFGFTSKEGDVIHTTPDPATCPDASKLGTVEVDSPLVDHPIKGSVHIADPYQNPFNSLLAIYITVHDLETGVVVKLAGEVNADPNTGRLTTTVLHNPQLPFEDFKLKFFGGAGGSLRTPATCGQYTTTSSLTPWSAPDSGPPDTPSDTWAITQAPDGGSCATSAGAQPNSPSFDAGTVTPIAKAYSPFVLHLRRADGSQNFQALNIKTPQGLLGKLAGISQCSDAALATAAGKSGAQERQSPSCPPNSELGTVVAGAGAGPAPYYAQGKAYLAGPYKGAPYSLAIITPATAGPFDLGTIVVKTALYVDSKTTQLSAVSDPIPSILQGIPLDVRTVDVSLDRPEFTFNPTSCDPMSVDGLFTSTLGQIAPLSSRFQVGECGRLGFKPRMSLSLTGGTTRGKHPALTAVLTPRAGDANIAALSVALPKSEFLDQSHIGTVCTRVQFAADECPAASIYGEATVFTPLLDYSLYGHVYLRSSDNLLPDLVTDFRGPAYQPVRIEAAGRTDSIKGGIRNTFDFVPDAPFTKLIVQLQGGKKGLLQNSRNICSQVYRATIEFEAHNGKTLTQRPPLKNPKCGKAKKRKGSKGAKRRAAQRAAR
jgi:hypothetical protein